MITTFARERAKPLCRIALRGVLLLGLLSLSSVEASAISKEVRRACMNDYFANCSAHRVGTPELRRCMRAVGPRLSKGCISALVAAGEVSKSELRRRSASLN